jgi:hypothetical protein
MQETVFGIGFGMSMMAHAICIVCIPNLFRRPYAIRTIFLIMTGFVGAKHCIPSPATATSEDLLNLTLSTAT